MKWHVAFLLIAVNCLHFAHAQDVRRCVRADGTIVYTDRVCAEQEQEKPQQLPAATPMTNSSTGTRLYIALPPSCNRSPDELLYGVRSAIAMNDVNQLAKHYHWLGVSDAQAEQLMTRLEVLANSPLVDIQLLYPAVAESDPFLSSADTSTEDSLDESQNSDAPSPQKHSAPYALRVVHYTTNTNSQTQSSTFHLQRHFDCWWIRY